MSTTADELRHKQQLYDDDVQIGQEMPPLVIGPMTTTHVFRWSSAIENWHRIHYDQDFAIYHDGLPNVWIQGSWKQSIMPRYLKDLCLPDGWMWKASFQHRAMIVPGDTITCWATVTNKYEKGGLGFVELDTGMRLQNDVESCPGQATIVLLTPLCHPRMSRARAEACQVGKGGTMGRWIAIGSAPGWDDFETFNDEMHETDNWRPDARTTVTTVFALEDGRLLAECHALKQESFEAWLQKKGWQVESITPIKHLAKTGSIWNVS